MLDGLRICFNTFLFRQLLVNEDEQAQYYEALKMNVQPPPPQYDWITTKVLYYYLFKIGIVFKEYKNRVW